MAPKTKAPVWAWFVAIVAIVAVAALVTLTSEPTPQANPLKPGQTTSTAPSQPILVTTEYVPFALSAYNAFIDDAANPTNIVTTATVKGRVFAKDAPMATIRSPTGVYVDTNIIAASTGSLNFTGQKIMTGSAYKMKVWDDTASPTWYPTLVDVNIPKNPPQIQYYTQAPNVLLQKIGTIADPMQEDATGAGGGALQTGVYSYHASNGVTVNLTEAAAIPTITIRYKVTLANTGVSTYLRNMVLVPKQDTSNPMSVTAFTSASITPITSLTTADGKTLALQSTDLLPYITSQTPFPLGDWDSSASGTYYVQISLNTPSLANGNQFDFRLDDQGGWQTTEEIAGQPGAASGSFHVNATI